MLAVQSGPEARPGTRYWVTWFALQALVTMGIVMVLPERRERIAGFLAFAYPVGLGAAQALLLHRFTPGSRRSIVTVVASIASVTLYQPLLVAVFMLGSVLVGTTSGRPGVVGDVLMIVLPLLGGAVAGLVQWWILHPRWEHAVRLVWAQAGLALLVSLAGAALFHDVPAWDSPSIADLPFARIVAGLVLGLVVAGTLRAVVLRLPQRSGMAHDEPAPASEPEPSATARWTQPAWQDIAIWILAHVGLMLALNALFPTVPRLPYFAAFAYGPTVGLLQSLLLYRLCAPYSSRSMAGIVAMLFVPTFGTLLATIPIFVVLLSLRGFGLPSALGHTPAGFPVPQPYPFLVCCLVTGLIVGWLHWRQLRSFDLHPRRPGLMFAAEAVAPLAASAVAWGLALLVPGYQPRAFAVRQLTTVYTEIAAAVAGLVVALLVGGAIWLALRPVPHDPAPEPVPES